MIRNCSLEEISDGKLYSENDMVKADTNQCQGCNSVCCHGMGDSIVLDPYDICRLTRQLQMPFESLESCIDMVPRLLQMAAVPTAIEFLERELAQGEELLAHLSLTQTEGAQKRAESLRQELNETKEAYHALQGTD